jgi:hypothetical protein
MESGANCPANRLEKLLRPDEPARKTKEIEMLASKSSRRNDVRRRSSKSRSIKAIYDDQRPVNVSRADWSNVFDSFMAAWAQNIVQSRLNALTRHSALTAA